ncbi:hypothetical protein O6H91_20G035100 [Diphasiastrum complanatum]|nr:hypothetical protein O6H91_20G033000 [Diphasiastrum complanatum]KAJ7519341.1 hypothetical protein O6H91_20G035100 [Diphasiastrum complanatum]
MQKYSSFINQTPTNFQDLTLETRRAIQQADNLKWQQEMFHRILKMIGLCNEGLVDKDELVIFRLKLLDRVGSSHEDGEWPDLTRDKLQFLQELLYANCISETEYHETKRPLLLRLAEQGASIDSNDVILLSSASKKRNKAITEDARTEEIPPKKLPGSSFDDASPLHKPKESHVTPKKSPVKLMAEAMSRLTTSKAKDAKAQVDNTRSPLKIPRALDFLRPDTCPVRDPPSPPCLNNDSPVLSSASAFVCSVERGGDGGEFTSIALASPPSYASACKFTFESPARTICLSPPRMSPASESSTSKCKDSSRTRVANLISDLMGKLRGDDAKQLSFDEFLKVDNFEQDLDLFSKDTWKPRMIQTSDTETADNIPSMKSSPFSKNVQNGQGPDTVKLKKKVHAKGAATDFFIDKVLGENIKRELERIRQEMRSPAPFTDDQIDAIATRLPVDKKELAKFVPKSWCDNYGDMVLEVVHREFKGHVGEMENLRKTAREKRTKLIKPSIENNENSDCKATGRSNVTTQKAAPKPTSVTRCFTTMGENVVLQTKQNQQQPISPLTPKRLNCSKHARDYYERDLDGKLQAEIQKMPHKKIQDSAPLRV